MLKKRSVKHLLTLEERLAIEAEDLRLRAKKVQPGQQRDNVLRRARQADTAAHMEDWMRSPGLQSPT